MKIFNGFSMDSSHNISSPLSFLRGAGGEVYTELQVTSNFSFLRGASHPDELVEQAAAYGYKSIAITDRNTFAGIVRAHAAAKKLGMRIIPACRLDLIDGPSLLAFSPPLYAHSPLSK